MLSSQGDEKKKLEAIRLQQEAEIEQQRAEHLLLLQKQEEERDRFE
jgi:hypothetical protein